MDVTLKKETKLSKKIISPDTLTGPQTFISILIIGVLFFIIGLVSWVNAILIPYFKISFELSNFQSYLIAFAFYIAYFVVSVPSSYLLKKVGFKKGIMIAFFIMAAGAFCFLPAANTRTYGIFLVGLFAMGSGLAILQTAANPYITKLGPTERAAQRFSIMGICNKGAGILAPLLFAAAVLKPTDNELFKALATMTEADKNQVLGQLIQRVIIPYSVVGVVLILLGFLVRYSPLPEIDIEQESPEVELANAGKKTIFDFPHLVMGVFAIFVHVGTQVIAIDTVINYAGSMQITMLEAKVFPSYTLAVTILGYLLGIVLIPKYISQLNALRLCTLLGTLFTCFILFARNDIKILGHVADISLWFVVLLGFANSMIWAGIWPLALDGLGRFTKIGSSVMIMALCGNAILPLIYGHVADLYNLRMAYVVLLPCYLYLVFYAFYGFRMRKWIVRAI